MNFNRETKSMNCRITKNLYLKSYQGMQREKHKHEDHVSSYKSERIIILMIVSLQSFSLFLYSIFTESDFYSGSINNNEPKINLHCHLQ